MRMTVIAGGIGGARFLQGVRAYARTIGGEVTAIVNVGDDVTLHGLRICPDLDSVMYTLGGGNDAERGWGRAKETWTVKEELAAYGLGPEWFGLGDRDIATHLTRSVMLTAGYPLSQVTEALNRRWQPGVRMIPATDDKVETHVVISAADAADQGLVTSETATAALEGGEYAMHFQEWWTGSGRTTTSSPSAGIPCWRPGSPRGRGRRWAGRCRCGICWTGRHRPGSPIRTAATAAAEMAAVAATTTSCSPCGRPVLGLPCSACRRCSAWAGVSPGC